MAAQPGFACKVRVLWRQAHPVDVGPVEGAPSKEELLAMVGKPEYKSDPAYRAKVEKAFEQVYGTEDYTPM